MKVFINGQSYDDWSQLPDQLKQQLAATLPDADKNGVPDVFEGKLPDLSSMQNLPGTNAFTSASIDVNGQTFDSVAALPPELRQLLQGVFGAGLAATQQPPATPAVAAGPPAAGPVAAAAAPGVPGPGQVILNGQPVQVAAATTAAPPEKKGLFRRLFGR